ncbi:hypothetical protein ZPR_2916 [Zunongwangia profunda SM-A87]|uniref:Uncharacterized protein n=1 Tax=Zunongwangia profunda (strain DSM 18752 / CCTCC AB 206139 / SM-A87) TaxID=655815 RepID=D5BGQ5_ZUNPS|nr:hypothetical protein ZPR_2916 [Zunongwangia profunda SM-A87]
MSKFYPFSSLAKINLKEIIQLKPKTSKYESSTNFN